MRVSHTFGAAVAVPNDTVRFGKAGEKLAARQFNVAVVDNFTDKTVDVDGDLVPDLSHGETISRFLMAENPRIIVTRFDTEGNGANQANQALGRVLQAMEAGDRFDGLNCSISLPVDYKSLSTQKAGKGITPQTLSQYGDAILQGIIEMAPARLTTLERMDALLQQIPFYVAAGNDGGKAFNVYGLLDGLKNVGATNANGKTAPYSNIDDRVNAFARGTFAVMPTAEGFDINADGKTDVMKSEVSGGTPMVAQFIGKPLSAVKITDDEVDAIQGQLAKGKAFSEIDLVYQRLFRVEQLRQLGVTGLRTSGNEYAMFAPSFSEEGLTANCLAGFTADDNGKVVYDPDESGRSGAVGVIHGTSYASPVALARDLMTGKAQVPQSSNAEAA